MHSTAPGLDQGVTVLFGSRSCAAARAPNITGRRSQALAGLKYQPNQTGLVAPLPAPQRIVPRRLSHCLVEIPGWYPPTNVGHGSQWRVSRPARTTRVTAADLCLRRLDAASGNSSSSPGRRSPLSRSDLEWKITSLDSLAPSSHPSSTCCYNHRGARRFFEIPPASPCTSDESVLDSSKVRVLATHRILCR